MDSYRHNKTTKNVKLQRNVSIQLFLHIYFKRVSTSHINIGNRLKEIVPYKRIFMNQYKFIDIKNTLSQLLPFNPLEYIHFIFNLETNIFLVIDCGKNLIKHQKNNTWQ